MKTNWIAFLLIFSFGLFICSCKEKANGTEKTDETTATEITEKEEDIEAEIEDPILVGKIKSSQLEVAPYDRWYAPSFKDHSLDKPTLKAITDKLNDSDITIFMGTWCEDSQREVPALFKILEAVNYDFEKMTIVAVSEEKDTPQGFEKGKDIINVPTIIINDGAKELGRIVEYPIESLEKDMAKILNGEPYKHAYED